MRKFLGAFLFLALFLFAAGPAFAQQTATQSLTLTVVAPTLSITTTTLSNGIVGTAYSRTMAATGGVAPLTWSVSGGALPTGLSLAAGTGIVSGTPTTAGPYSVTIKVTDNETTPQVATATFTPTVYAKLVFTTTTLPNATIGTPYTGTVSFTGGAGPFTCSVSSGSLPAGLTISQTGSACVISGTPSSTGTFAFTLQVSDASNLAMLQIRTTLTARNRNETQPSMFAVLYSRFVALW